MRSLLIAAYLIAVVTVTAASSPPETLDVLKQRAAAARIGDQPKLFLEVAERQLHAARDAYEQDKPEEGRAAVSDVASYCEQAAAAAIHSQKYLKQAEIRVRDLIKSLEALHRSLASDDRAPVQTVINRLENVRSDLLGAMFGRKP
ncbi:MAG: hypothetical protein ABSD20_19460 [Terriglobales bacterium]|jgi:hypothetical protein